MAKMNITPEEFKNMTQEEKIAYMDSIKHETQMYSMYDRVAQEFSNIILNNKGNAMMIREFFELINDKRQEKFYNHPEDYELWSLGTFNTRTGEIEEQKTFITNGLKAVEQRIEK